MVARRVLAKTLLFSLVVPGTVAVGVPVLLGSRVGGSPAVLGPLRWIGLLPVLAGVAIYARTAWDFAAGGGTPAPIDEPRTLVTVDRYDRVRNPMYVGVLLVIAGEALLFGSLADALYALAVFLAFHAFVVGYEEPNLRRKYGESYVEYCDRVPRWLPRLRGRTSGRGRP